MNNLHSINDFNEAKQVIAGGLNSPRRLLGSVHTIPPFMIKGEGSYLHDADGNAYLDFVQSGGALIFGHSDEEIEQASIEMIKNGVGFGVPLELEATLAKEIICLFDGMEKVRFLSSEMESMLSAISLAKDYSGKMGVVWFESSCAQDDLSNGAKTFFQHLGFCVFSIEYHDREALKKCFLDEKIGCVVIEPFGVGAFEVDEEFLADVRKICDEFGAILIFNECASGLRVFRECEVIPDLRVLGGVFGAGMPFGVLGGSDELMKLLSKKDLHYSSDVNPIAVGAGLMSVLKFKAQKGLNENLERLAQTLMEGFQNEADKRGIMMQTRVCGSMFGFSFGKKDSHSYHLDYALFAHFHQKILQRGIYFAPSMFQSNFVCVGMNDEEINWVIRECGEVLEEIIYE